MEGRKSKFKVRRHRVINGLEQPLVRKGEGPGSRKEDTSSGRLGAQPRDLSLF